MLHRPCSAPVHANDGDVCLVHLQPLDEAALAPLAPAFLAKELDFAQRCVVCETVRQSCAAVVLDLILVEHALLDGSISREHLGQHRRARVVQAAVGQVHHAHVRRAPAKRLCSVQLSRVLKTKDANGYPALQREGELHNIDESTLSVLVRMTRTAAQRRAAPSAPGSSGRRSCSQRSPPPSKTGRSPR